MIQKFQNGRVVNPKLYNPELYKQYVAKNGYATHFGGSNTYVPGFYVYYDEGSRKLIFHQNPYPYKVEHSNSEYGGTSFIYDKSGQNIIDVVPYGSIREVAPKQTLEGYTDKYGRYVPAKQDMKSKRYWEIDPNRVMKDPLDYNRIGKKRVIKKQYGGNTPRQSGSLSWWGREFKNLFRGIVENRKPSEYDSTTQTFKGDGAELKGGNFGGSGGGSEWPKPEPKIKPKKKLLEPIFSVETETFNDAFADARKKGKPTFWFNGKLYNTKLGGGAEAQKAGAQRRRISGIRIHGALPE